MKALILLFTKYILQIECDLTIFLQDFERGRIRALQEERLYIQKKTFTKWMNSFLQKARMEVEDLFVDLADGRKLLKLLEIISGDLDNH